MSGIFINYRSDDSGTAAMLIDRELAARFGSDRVFLDSRSIPAGADFVEELLERVRASSVLLVVIGRRWLTLTDAAGKRRIDDPADWVRCEIAEALSLGMRVIPVLLDDVKLPTETDLSEDIAGLSRRQYVSLRRRYTDLDLAGLVDRIVKAEPELAKIATGRRSEKEPVPQQLPAAVAHFSGRADELARLTGLLRGHDQRGGTVVISAIGGTAGVGKTTLAVHWAHQVIERFPDGQLYINLRGFDPTGEPMQPGEAVRGFLEAFEIPPERIPVSFEAQTALYRSLLAERRVLVVLDNARDTEQVRPLLPGSPTCLVLITSRDQLRGLVAREGAQAFSLKVLTEREATDLLARRLGRERVETEREAVRELIERCARLPLALVLVAARAATYPDCPLGMLVDELRDEQERLDALDADDPGSGPRAVFSWSYCALTPPAAALFRLLGLHVGQSIGVPAVAALAGVRNLQAKKLLVELTRVHLLEEPIPGRYEFHDLLRSYAAELAAYEDPESHRQTAVQRVLDFYLHTGFAADRCLAPQRGRIALDTPHPDVLPHKIADHTQALSWFIIERSTLLAVIEYATAHGFDRHAWQLAWTLVTFFERQGHWPDWLATQRIAVAAAARLGDQAAQARAHRLLSRAAIRLGRYTEAADHLQQAITLYQELGNQLGQARTHMVFSWVRELQERYAEAVSHAEQSLTLFRTLGHRAGEARALEQLGWEQALLGDHEQGHIHCQRALDLFQELDHRPGQADTLDSLGYIYHHLGQHTQAITHYEKSIAMSQELDDHHTEATTYTRLGDTYLVLGDHSAAQNVWQQALTILDRVSPPDADDVRTKLAALTP